MNKKPSTSWENVEGWYSSLVGEKGHYYHQSLILPGAKRLLGISSALISLLDLGCGQGVFERSLPQNIEYLGIDASASLLDNARKLSRRPKAAFIQGNAERLEIQKKDFDCAAFILSLQNIEHPMEAIGQASKHLKNGGKLLIVLNHPCFRIPRQSSWGIDEANKIQYRRINRYLTPMKIPIQMHMKQNDPSNVTYSFHHPLSDYVHFLNQNNLSVIGMEEWCSDKTSTGSKAKMEDRARKEIPLFLAILSKKTPIQ